MAKTGGEELKRCFLIAPLGEEGSDTRRRSDQVLRYIINPVLEDCGYAEAVRPDHLGKPNVIVPAVIERVMDDPLVIADLSDRDPIVYYLLAIRHMSRKPLVKMVDAAQPSPFDVAHSRIIRLDVHDLDSVDYCRRELKQQIKHVEKKPVDGDNPINNFVDLTHLRESGDPDKRDWAQMFAMLSEMQLSLEAALQRFQAADARPYSGETGGLFEPRQAPESAGGSGPRDDLEVRRKSAPELSQQDVSRLSSLLAEAAKDLRKPPR
ncbi:MAG: hypothetical protein LC114_10475 [Bryobacterales bacterium]|nr:hypothetical protein [Bryobacterales bacterium]